MFYSVDAFFIKLQFSLTYVSKHVSLFRAAEQWGTNKKLYSTRHKILVTSHLEVEYKKHHFVLLLLLLLPLLLLLEKWWLWVMVGMSAWTGTTTKKLRPCCAMRRTVGPSSSFFQDWQASGWWVGVASQVVFDLSLFLLGCRQQWWELCETLDWRHLRASLPVSFSIKAIKINSFDKSM